MPRFGVVPGEQTAEVLGVAEIVVDQRRGVGVGDDVIVEPQVIAEHMVHERTEQHDVGSGPDRDVLVAHRRRAGEPRVDVDHRRATGPRLLHPLEAHRMALGHVGALDDDAVGVGHVLQRLCGTAPPEGGSQTGNRGGVSYAGLVLDLDRARCGEEFLDQIVLFVVQGRAAEGGDPHRAT